jgi:hypothetical protein
MPDLQVASRSVNTVVDFTVSAAYSGDGEAVDYDDASISVQLHNTSDAQAYGERDALYRVDSGQWVVLPPGSKQSVAIDMATQTLTMKRAQFADDVSVSMTVTGVPSGLYAGETALAGVTAAGLAALGVEGVLCSKEFLFTEIATPGVYEATMDVATGTLVVGAVMYALASPWQVDPNTIFDMFDSDGYYFYQTGLSDSEFAVNRQYNPAAGTYDNVDRRGWRPNWAVNNAADFNKFAMAIDTTDFDVSGPGRRYALSNTITLRITHPDAAVDPVGVLLVKVFYYPPTTAVVPIFTP